jgi:type IV pilus assembly protein PilB
MKDPGDAAALEEITEYSGLPVRPMIAPPSDIRAAIRAYYLGLPPEPPQETAPAIASIPPQSPAVPSRPPEMPQEEHDEPVKARDSSMPQPVSDAEQAVEMITLTMLDGTQMKLPASARGREGASSSGLTARDLVEALRAHADGSDVSEVLGEDVDWQRLFAALLSLLLKKHLIVDWEFVRELRNYSTAKK